MPAPTTVPEPDTPMGFRLSRSVAEFFAYGIAAAAALAVDLGVLLLLVKQAGWPYLLAATASFIAGGVFLYFISITFVFRVRRIANPALELSAFVALGIAGLLINLAVIGVGVEFLHANYLIAKGAASGCTFGANFLLRRHLMFSPARPS